MGFLTKVKNVYNSVVREAFLPAKVDKKELTRQKINNILEKTYYDELTNTIVLDLPVNLVVKTEGSQIFMCKSGLKIDIAEQIHLNPILPSSSTLNINKQNSKLSEILNTVERAIHKK